MSSDYVNTIVAKNIQDKTFTDTTKFIRCNLKNVTFNARCYCDRCNIIECTQVDENCTCEKSNIINNEED